MTVLLESQAVTYIAEVEIYLERCNTLPVEKCWRTANGYNRTAYYATLMTVTMPRATHGIHWCGQLWGTGAHASTISNNFHFSHFFCSPELHKVWQQLYFYKYICSLWQQLLLSAAAIFHFISFFMTFYMNVILCLSSHIFSYIKWKIAAADNSSCCCRVQIYL